MPGKWKKQVKNAVDSQSTESLIAKDIVKFAADRESMAVWCKNLETEDLDWLQNKIATIRDEKLVEEYIPFIPVTEFDNGMKATVINITDRTQSAVNCDDGIEETYVDCTYFLEFEFEGNFFNASLKITGCSSENDRNIDHRWRFDDKEKLLATFSDGIDDLEEYLLWESHLWYNLEIESACDPGCNPKRAARRNRRPLEKRRERMKTWKKERKEKEEQQKKTKLVG